MKARFLFLVALMLLTTSAAFAQNVNVDWQHGTDFTKFKTYAWGVSKQPIQDPLWNQRAVGDIDNQLAAKGLTKVDATANPDLVVVYSAGVKNDVSIEGYRTGFVMGSVNVQEVVQRDATLVVDLADPKQKMVIWRGTAEDTLSDKSDKNIEKLQKAVSKMFQKYPPKQK